MALRTAHVVILTALFYDASHKLISREKPPYTGAMSPWGDRYFDATVPVPQEARYLVLYAAPEDYGHQLPFHSQGTTAAGGVMIRSESDWLIPTGPGGVVSVQFTNRE